MCMCLNLTHFMSHVLLVSLVLFIVSMLSVVSTAQTLLHAVCISILSILCYLWLSASLLAFRSPCPWGFRRRIAPFAKQLLVMAVVSYYRKSKHGKCFLVTLTLPIVYSDTSAHLAFASNPLPLAIRTYPRKKIWN